MQLLKEKHRFMDMSSNNTTESSPYISSSAETVANNPDLLTQILLRVPAKPLGKFKCVSKQWLSLISNSQFYRSHIRLQKTLNPTPSALLLNQNYCSTPEFLLVSLENEEVNVPSLDYFHVPSVRMLQSCNGLLLCFSVGPSWEKTYFVCNPTTKQFKTLVLSHEVPRNPEHLCLAFDPLQSVHYKVVCVYLPLTSPEVFRFLVDVYSSETDSWSRSRVTFGIPLQVHFDVGVFCNGALHWYSYRETSLYFHVDSDTLNAMPMIPTSSRDGTADFDILYFGESQGHLLIATTKDLLSLQFNIDISEMLPDYSGWSLKYHVNFDPIRMIFPRNDFSVLSIIQKTEKTGDQTAVILGNGRAMSYNLHNGSLTSICDLRQRPGNDGSAEASNQLHYDWNHAYGYFESLICI